MLVRKINPTKRTDILRLSILGIDLCRIKKYKNLVRPYYILFTKCISDYYIKKQLAW